MGLFIKRKLENPFKDELNTVVFSCRHVMYKKENIKFISHDSNGDWDFFCKDCGNKLDLDNVMIVSLTDVLKIYPDIGFFSNLENNNYLILTNEEWVKYKTINDDYNKWLIEIKDAIVNENIKRNRVLRSDFSGIKIQRK